MTDFESGIKDLLQKALVDAMDKPVVVTGWVSSVNILVGDKQHVVNVQPAEQSPALTTGILTHGKQLNMLIGTPGVDGYETGGDE